jgi:putative ABC transport system ATP-binding protein
MMAMLDDNPLVTCRGLTKVYGSGNAEVHALRGIDLDVYGGELTMLVGPSGCGKTTLLSVLAGILRPTAGSVDALGTDLTSLSSWQRTAFRRQNVGFVFQQFNLLPALTAAENAAVPLVIQGYSKRRAVTAAKELLEKMGMGDRANSLPAKLSGGQQQRVAIARALIHSPHLLVCDEPTSALDHKTGHTILEILRNVAVEGDRAVIIVTHDSRIFEFADTMAHMDDGHIESLERSNKRDPEPVIKEIASRQRA